MVPGKKIWPFEFHTSYLATFMMYMELLIIISLADDKGVHEVNLDAE